MFNTSRRVVVLLHKSEARPHFEIFSNLKILCATYPRYNYNTLNNYLSKEKVAFENNDVRIERQLVHSVPVPKRKLAMHVNRIPMKEGDHDLDDMDFWISKSPAERLAAVTSLSAQFKKPGQRMIKALTKRKMKL